MAMLPLADNRCALVWTRPGADAERLAALPESAFLDELQAAFGYRLGALRKVGARHLYPLALVEAISSPPSRIRSRPPREINPCSLSSSPKASASRAGTASCTSAIGWTLSVLLITNIMFMVPDSSMKVWVLASVQTN